MKKALKITGITILSILLILIIAPFAFKGKFRGAVISQFEKMFDSKVDFGKVDISLLCNFPLASLTVDDFVLSGTDIFEKDTLVFAKRISATMNIKSLFAKSGFELTRIDIRGVKANAIVLEDGKANWDIVKSSGEQSAEESDGESDFRLQLKRFTLRNAHVTFNDKSSGTYANLSDINLTCSGDFTAAKTLMRIKTEITSASAGMGTLPLLADAKVSADIDLDADLENMSFTLRENRFVINALKTGIDGTFAVADNGYDMDVTLTTETIAFKDLLSLIPTLYSQEFASMQASGNVRLAAWAKGKLTDTTVPSFEANIDISEGSIRYPALPAGIDGINIDALVNNPGGDPDQTLVKSDIAFVMAGNLFSSKLNVAKPVSDPEFNVSVRGLIDLGKIKDVFPIDGIKLNGSLDGDLAFAGRMSQVEAESYDLLRVTGVLKAKDILISPGSIPDIIISGSEIYFTPQYVTLGQTNMSIGRSDLAGEGRVGNYLGYAFRGTTLTGNLDLRSNLLDVNELLSDDTAVQDTTTSSSSGVFRIPDNLDMSISANVAKVLYSNMDIENVKGKLIIRNSAATMQGLSLGILEGKVTANGTYSTATENPKLAADFRMDSVSFAKTFETFTSVRALAPVIGGLKGNFSGALILNTMLDNDMSPIAETMSGNGSISSRQVELSGIKPLDAIADVVQMPGLKNLKAKDFSVSFDISAGRISTKPFDIKAGNYTMNLSGSTGIDQSIDYKGKLSLPESTGAIVKYTTVDLKIGGTFSSPTVSLDAQGMVEQAVDKLIDETRDKALGTIGDKLGIDISNAEKQRETLISQAQQAGDKLVEEARKQAEKLTQEAGSNAVKKLAAQKAGELLVAEAEKQSKALVTKATEEGDRLVEKARSGTDQE